MMQLQVEKGNKHFKIYKSKNELKILEIFLHTIMLRNISRWGLGLDIWLRKEKESIGSMIFLVCLVCLVRSDDRFLPFQELACNASFDGSLHGFPHRKQRDHRSRKWLDSSINLSMDIDITKYREDARTIPKPLIYRIN